MTPHVDIHVHEPSQVGEARRMALRLASGHELGEDVCGRIALVVTELGTNLVRHAQAGRLLMACKATEHGAHFEVISIDSGPGMQDVNQCLLDGYSTGTTPGTGFGAVRRLSTDFSVYSKVDCGTVILSRIRVSEGRSSTPRAALVNSQFVHAGICLCAPGEVVSGDAWDIRIEDGEASVIVADGLGHGPEAAEAAQVAVAVFRNARGSPRAVLEQAHPLMRQTRGAAVSISTLDLLANTVVAAGAGNVSGRIISGLSDRSLLSQHGTLGLKVRTLQDATYAWPEHALLVMHSDGLQTRWKLDGLGGLLRCDPAVIAGWLIRDHTRGLDDVTVVVVKRA
ncbi:ATP-binding protein [Aquabacterium sp. CECT 9606]|uniref:ATP-binding protein n=1 Tax=Aquabacterium sp. CECT 9606 TaxID=2845822 RepID=UPI001E35E4CD|nr:ATP-binding protein [Aquabacterium sp. CECT 9606]CAH0351190.1 hypothetical protein AQB9606_01969 [Aquabacterium sp. CECT 9606]